MFSYKRPTEHSAKKVIFTAECSVRKFIAVRFTHR